MTGQTQIDGANGILFDFATDAILKVRNRADTLFAAVAGAEFKLNNVVTFSSTAPTITSGFGTSPSITAGTATAFRLNVGTGGVASSGVIGLPIAAMGWNCSIQNLSTNTATVFLTKQTSSTPNTATIGNYDAAGAPAAWVASDILGINCTAL